MIHALTDASSPKVYKVRPLCRVFGISRQAYYQHKDDVSEEDVLISTIAMYCRHLRCDENLPKAGSRELYDLCKKFFEDRFTLGRDKFNAILRANGLMLRKRKKSYPNTTNSNHSFKIYTDLVNTDPKFVAQKPGDLVVADITYIPCRQAGGFAYLSLVTQTPSAEALSVIACTET